MIRVSKTDTDIEWTDTDTIFSNYPGYTDTDIRIFVIRYTQWKAIEFLITNHYKVFLHSILLKHNQFHVKIV